MSRVSSPLSAIVRAPFPDRKGRGLFVDTAKIIREDITDYSDRIEGVLVKKLRVMKDDRGYLMEMIRADDPFFRKFGQVYVTYCEPGFVKGWHYHKVQIDHFVVIKGNGRVLLYDARENSKSKGNWIEFIMGDANPICVVIPVGVLHGIECAPGEKEGCLLLNMPTEMYRYREPDEFRIDPFDNDVPIKWHSNKGG
ncbi:MAG TPA: dTDP-4-dehydrorhamnose 3,5-epimerase family protein [Candidatus Nanoarchaeia archaeon]|nr:hypothetical protein [uncultured archaeon]HLC46534.1 dTDP-4-dehydrorhamnose 3,5-epimerase family protein [Candidatus Nanoarchaeia archaeon]